MANSSIQLTVPTPCQQHWQAMKTVEAGRFCTSCQKTVVDFSSMSDQQIADYLLNQSQHTCGRFTPGQLNRNLITAPDLVEAPVKQRWLGLLTAGLLSWSVAEGKPIRVADTSPVQAEVSFYDLVRATNTGIDGAATSMQRDSARVFEGQVVVESTKEPLGAASVSIKGTSWETKTDADGRFRLILPDYQDDKYIIAIKAFGFATQEITMSAIDKWPVVVLLREEVLLLREVVVTQKPTGRQKLWKRIRGKQ